jgi:hypothetical protein
MEERRDGCREVTRFLAQLGGRLDLPVCRQAEIYP